VGKFSRLESLKDAPLRQAPANVVKNVLPYFTNIRNKLEWECLYVASLSILVFSIEAPFRL
jgi:hypothetical protein